MLPQGLSGHGAAAAEPRMTDGVWPAQPSVQSGIVEKDPPPAIGRVAAEPRLGENQARVQIPAPFGLPSFLLGEGWSGGERSFRGGPRPGACQTY